MSKTAAATKDAPQPRSGANLRIGDILVEKRLVTQEQLQQAIVYKKEKAPNKLLGEVLVDLKFVTEDQVMDVVAQIYQVPYVKLNPKLIDPKMIETLPRQFIEEHGVLPLFLVNGKLTVAVSEPSNMFLIEEIGRLSKCQVQIVAATIKDIRAALQSTVPTENVFKIDSLVEDIKSEDLVIAENQIADITKLEEGSSESPVVKLVNYLIYCAAHEGASDIHIEPSEKQLRVRYRIDGVLFEKMKPPYQLHPAMVSRIKIMSGLDISERRAPQDGVISVMMEQRPIDLRVSTMPGKFGEKVVMRVVDKRNVQIKLDLLGFSKNVLEPFRKAVNQPNGIVLVTGPTGSGKSTTLYAALSEISDDSLNICTVEDPIEYSLPGVNQFQVNEKAGFSFAGALRSLLRQDPDVIMLGEIRDVETAKTAIQAALTGHLVLSTLHTNDAASAVTRLFNIGVEPYLVAASIKGVLAQRLIRRICKHCKDEVKLNPADKRTLERLSEGAPPIEQVFAGTGCPKCRNTGYSGRVGIHELLVPDDETLDAVSRGATLQEVRRMARAAGYTTLRQDGVEKIRGGLTTIKELLTAVESED